MRAAAKRSASSAAAGHWASAAATSSGVTRSRAGVSATRSKRRVRSMTAASPRVRTSSMIAATAASTSASTSRFSATSVAKDAAKPGARLSSLRGIGRLAEALDPAAHLLGARLQGGAVDDEARGDVGDVLDLDEAVRLQGAAGLHQIDDLPAEADARRELHGAVELDAFGLD